MAGETYQVGLLNRSPKECKHKRWSVSMADKAYHGHCDTCGKQVHLALLINATAQEMQSLVDEFGKTLKQLRETMKEKS